MNHSPSPFEKRLLDLQLLPRPDTAEELAFLEDYIQWKSNGGPDQAEQKRNKERWRQFNNTNAMIKKLTKKP